MAEDMADRNRDENETPPSSQDVRDSKAAIPPRTRRVVGYFDEWGNWCYGYRDPGNWLTASSGYDYRQ